MENKNKFKYGEADKIEAWTDTHIYFHIAEKGSHFMRKLGFTPNDVTFLSLVTQLYSCYLLFIRLYL